MSYSDRFQSKQMLAAFRENSWHLLLGHNHKKHQQVDCAFCAKKGLGILSKQSRGLVLLSLNKPEFSTYARQLLTEGHAFLSCQCYYLLQAALLCSCIWCDSFCSCSPARIRRYILDRAAWRYSSLSPAVYLTPTRAVFQCHISDPQNLFFCYHHDHNFLV